MKLQAELKEIIQLIKGYLEAEKEAGFEEFILPEAWPKAERRQLKIENKEVRLQSLKNKIRECEKCSLCKTRKNVVFGEGDINARLMFVGEAPGSEEDLQGLPFVGRAGQLLTKIIEAMGFKREDVYICNILKCRPPQNRNPSPPEVIACEGYLKEQIEIIKPKIICALGKFSAQLLSGSEESISRLRGNFFDYQGVKLMPTFHPAYLLRNPAGKKPVWEDMKKINRELEQ